MNIILFTLIVATFLAFTTLLAATIISTRSLSDREKTSPFECGFDPKNISRTPFSLRFFLLALIFLVFDIEIILLIPLPLIFCISTNLPAISTPIIFLLILIVGLLHEWHEGALNWYN